MPIAGAGSIAGTRKLERLGRSHGTAEQPDRAGHRREVRKAYEIAIPAESFARAVAFAVSESEEVDVNEILFRPTRQEL